MDNTIEVVGVVAKLYICVWEVPSSDTRTTSGTLTDFFCNIPHSFQVNAGIVAQ